MLFLRNVFGNHFGKYFVKSFRKLFSIFSVGPTGFRGVIAPLFGAFLSVHLQVYNLAVFGCDKSSNKGYKWNDFTLTEICRFAHFGANCFLRNFGFWTISFLTAFLTFLLTLFCFTTSHFCFILTQYVFSLICLTQKVLLFNLTP